MYVSPCFQYGNYQSLRSESKLYRYMFHLLIRYAGGKYVFDVQMYLLVRVFGFAAHLMLYVFPTCSVIYIRRSYNRTLSVTYKLKFAFFVMPSTQHCRQAIASRERAYSRELCLLVSRDRMSIIKRLCSFQVERLLKVTQDSMASYLRVYRRFV